MGLIIDRIGGTQTQITPACHNKHVEGITHREQSLKIYIYINMNAQCGFKSIAKRHPMDTTRHRTICQCWAFRNGHLIITFLVSYAQLLKENGMNGVLKKHTSIANKILLTYKLDPQRGSLLWSTKANMPASWRRGGNCRWDETSGFFLVNYC